MHGKDVAELHILTVIGTEMQEEIKNRQREPEPDSVTADVAEELDLPGLDVPAAAPMPKESKLRSDRGRRNGTINRLGLALSGGGFRATLYHLGVLRCLRDAGVLPKITHITTVSGGSILGAHLVLNWDRYCGTEEEFDEAAKEIFRFVQLDVRNRIVRRFPFAAALNRIRSILLLGPRRQWTRAGLLESYYERFLYGDTPLSKLPKRPRLHILSTNLSEGCLCSFNQAGLLVQRRAAGRRDRFERVEMGLATVPMAVAASSCFPGFFPPLELTGWDVGADVGEFVRQSFTDGGVYDNLGLRMFRCLEQSGSQHSTPLHQHDFLALEDTMSALRTADELPDDAPLGRLRALVDRHLSRADQELAAEQPKQFTAAMIAGLWEVIRSEKLYRDPVLEKVEVDEPSAQSMLNYLVISQREPDLGDRLWLNRMIIEAVLRQVIGKSCLRITRKDFDGILVSDAGGKFKVNRDSRGGGLISTALRSSDILMDRVWQLESEVFENTTGVVFIPIFDVVDRGKDRHAIDPELQRQASRIRTDLDYFTDLEISVLVQHGYGVARQICRQNESLVDGGIPSGPPWNPLADSENRAQTGDQVDADVELINARRLRDSSKRKVLSTLLSWDDWPSYVWLVLIIALAVGGPYLVLQRNERLAQQETVLSAVAELDPNYQRVVELLREPSVPNIMPMKHETVTQLKELDQLAVAGFEVLSDSRIFDLRGWEDPNAPLPVVGYNRTRVRRLPDNANNLQLRLQRDIAVEQYSAICRPARFHPTLSRMDLGDGRYRWELQFDLSSVPLNSHADIEIESILPSEMASAFEDEGRFDFSVRSKTGLLQVWLLMPEGRKYGLFEVSSHPIGQPELSEVVVPAAVVRVALGSVATFRLINPEPNRRYECRWTWGNAAAKAP